jgi:phospholipid/cholesterol/gamma-HCH transport system substrate-binding protein
MTFRVGVLMAAAIALLCFAIFSIGHGSRLFKHTDLIQAHFQRINGLQTGAPVTFAGVNIGAVYSIEFPRDKHADYVIVRMWIESRALERIRVDSVARIATMGLLGDKYVEISTGSSGAPVLTPGAVIPSQNPIDYEAVLQKTGTGDLIANTIAISQSLRALLETIQKGHGVLSQLIKGESGVAPEQQFSLVTMEKTMQSMNVLSLELNKTLRRINRGQGLAGAMFSSRTHGRRLLANINHAAEAMRSTAHKMDHLVDRFSKAQGTVPRLFADKRYGDRILANMLESSEDLKDILHKINTGQGSIGLAVNDPTLYRNATGLMSGSAGWGLGLMNSLYSLTHPFYNPATGVTNINACGPAEPVISTSVSGSSAPANTSASPASVAP